MFSKPEIEDFDSGRLVDDGFLLFGFAARLTEFCRGGDGGVAFVDVNEGQIRKAEFDFAGEASDFFCRWAFFAIEVEREPEDECADASLFAEDRDAFDRVGRGERDRLDRMGENAEWIGSSDADASVAVVDSESGVGCGVQMEEFSSAELNSGIWTQVMRGGDRSEWARLEQFRRELGGEVLDRVGLVTIGDEQGVVGLDDDQVIHAEERDLGSFAGVENDIVFGIDLGDGGIDSIVVADGFEVFGDGDPGADIVPVEGGLDVKNAPCLFHEGVVDGNRGELGELSRDGGVEVFGRAQF